MSAPTCITNVEVEATERIVIQHVFVSFEIDAMSPMLSILLDEIVCSLKGDLDAGKVRNLEGVEIKNLNPDSPTQGEITA